MMTLYAHTPNEAGKWHLLDEHLRAVAELAAEHAEAFGASDVAWWAGILHDAGKASEEFQNYLKLCHEQPNRKHKSVDHKGAGARRAQQMAGPLAYLIQGHHGGLPGAKDLGTKRKKWDTPPENTRITNALAAFDQLGIVPTHAPGAPPAFATRSPLAIEVFMRMLFSALVDADHADTESHFAPEESTQRNRAPEIPELWNRFEQDQARFEAALDPAAASTTVNEVRREVYAACLAAAEREPGFFRLTVPTGGGKTRSGLAFALKHAFCHGLRRVIVAVPYLTITDQTAEVYRAALGGERAVLEHHSAAGERDDQSGEPSPQETWRRLAAQDWHATVIVTTMVQLFESLFSNSPSKCRKLHRIAGSVIVLDEAQTLPAGMRGPIFDMLRELVEHYRVSVVLCTATQPALDTLEEEIKAATPVREIAPEPARLFRALERVTYCWPAQSEQWNWERAADELRTSDQALAVLNTIPNAISLFEALNDPNAFHLSTMMCGAHRRDVLAVIRERLEAGEPCRVVSTQLVEAGVDIDFPLVLRAIGPLDRLAQAAGRCNRAGKLERGRIVIFKPEKGGMPRGAYMTGTGETLSLLNEGEIDMNDPETFLRYFHQLFSALPPDEKGIQPLRQTWEFSLVAENFEMIANDSVSVIVRYPGTEDDPEQLERVNRMLSELRSAPSGANKGSGRELLRRLQPFMVNVRRTGLPDYIEAGLVAELAPDVWEWRGGYDLKRGLTATQLDPILLYVD